MSPFQEHALAERIHQVRKASTTQSSVFQHMIRMFSPVYFATALSDMRSSVMSWDSAVMVFDLTLIAALTAGNGKLARLG